MRNHQKKKKYSKDTMAQLPYLHLPILVNQNRNRQATATLLQSGNAPMRDWNCTFKDILIYLIHWNWFKSRRSDENSYIKLKIDIFECRAFSIVFH
jgi:hypothetical protein